VNFIFGSITRRLHNCIEISDVFRVGKHDQLKSGRSLQTVLIVVAFILGHKCAETNLSIVTHLDSDNCNLLFADHLFDERI